MKTPLAFLNPLSLEYKQRTRQIGTAIAVGVSLKAAQRNMSPQEFFRKAVTNLLVSNNRLN